MADQTDEQSQTDETADAEIQQQESEERQQAAEEFAAEHDPANHDLSAGEEFRQRGDWTADKAGEPQVWDSDGNLVEGSESAGTLSPGDVADADADAGTHAGEDAGDAAGDGAAEAASTQGDAAPDGRRVSELEEVVDGGYSVGSAAPIEDGAMPLGHPVKAWNDTMTFLAPGAPGYVGADPHVWFTDAQAAQNAGFGPAN